MRIARDVEAEINGVGSQSMGLSGSAAYSSIYFGATHKDMDNPSLLGLNKTGLGSVSHAQKASQLSDGSGKGLKTSTHSFASSKASSMASHTVNSPARGGGDRTSNMVQSKGVRHLSYQELMEMKSKGLCFRCGEKYHPLHQCAAFPATSNSE